MCYKLVSTSKVSVSAVWLEELLLQLYFFTFGVWETKFCNDYEDRFFEHGSWYIFDMRSGFAGRNMTSRIRGDRWNRTEPLVGFQAPSVGSVHRSRRVQFSISVWKKKIWPNWTDNDLYIYIYINGGKNIAPTKWSGPKLIGLIAISVGFGPLMYWTKTDQF